MKTYLLFLSYLFTVNSLCQSWEKVDQRSETVSYSNATQLADGRWLVAGWANPSGGIPVAMHFATVFEPDGSIAREQEFAHSVMDIGSIAPYPDGGFVTAGPWDGCDFWAEDSLMRLDNTGELVWRTSLPGMNGPVHVVVDQMGNIITASNTIAIVDPDGVLITQFPAPINYIYRMLLQSDSSLLLLGFDQLHRIDLNGVALSNPITVGSEVLDFTVTPDHIFLLAADQAHIYDHQMQPIVQHDLSSISPIKGFAKGGSGVHIFNDTGLYLFDPVSGASVIDTFDPIADHTVTAAGIDGADLWTFGNQTIHFRTSAATRKRPLNEVLEFDEDVEILVSIDSAWVTPLQQNSMYFEEKAAFTLQIVNHTPSILEQCVVSLRVDLMFWLCGAPAETWMLDDLNLLPGDTFSLTVPGTTTGYRYASAAGTTVERSICLAVLAPNDKLDRQPIDNHACDTTPITYPVGLAEHVVLGDLKVFPNPFVDRITLDLQDGPNKEGTVLIHDQAGRLVHSEQMELKGGSQTIDLFHLAPGPYSLTIASTGEVARCAIVRADDR